MSAALEYRRLRAPRETGAALIEPPLPAAGELLARNIARRAAYDYDVQGRSLAELAESARREMLDRAARYTSSYRDISWLAREASRVILSGHQPQLFHPGVWFKNFALSSLAAAHDAVGVNLVVDSDTIKTSSIRVPSGSIEQPILATVVFDRPADEIPFEERSVLQPELFEQFGARVAETIAPLVSDPLVTSFWPLAIEQLRRNENLGQCLAQARHRLEGEWGLRTLELPQSELGRLPAFHWFTAHLFVELPRLREIYNQALVEYRRVHRLRSRSHPVPDLAAEGDWLEAPFWIWSTAQPRRRPVFVRAQGRRLIVSDRAGQEFGLDLAADQPADRAVEQLAALEAQGVKLRTRALMTTLFARLFLGDLFLHGIGGAKYDQLTDQLMQRFFGVAPPDFMTLTATARLPIPQQPFASDAVRQIDRTLREFVYHPERQIDAAQLPPDEQTKFEQLAATKQKWIATPQTPENARARHKGITRVNEALQAWLEPRRRELLAERAQRETRLRSAALLNSREHAFCLFPESSLRTLLLDLSAVRL